MALRYKTISLHPSPLVFDQLWAWGDAADDSYYVTFGSMSLRDPARATIEFSR